MIKARHILIGAGAAVAAYGVSYLLKLNRLSNELETITKASIHNVSLSGIELRINVTLKNPSGGSVKVKQPFVKLMYGDTVLASSQMQDTNIAIPKFSEVSTAPIMLNIGFVSLATAVPQLLKGYRETGKLALMVKTVTTINDSLPYSKMDNITLGGGKEA
jgi:hypothetical protein